MEDMHMEENVVIRAFMIPNKEENDYAPILFSAEKKIGLDTIETYESLCNIEEDFDITDNVIRYFPKEAIENAPSIQAVVNDIESFADGCSAIFLEPKSFHKNQDFCFPDYIIDQLQDLVPYSNCINE